MKKLFLLFALLVSIVLKAQEADNSWSFTASANFYFFSDFENKLTSESYGIAVKKDKHFQFQKLSHTDFKELKFAIDDYGNINYLDQDF